MNGFDFLNLQLEYLVTYIIIFFNIVLIVLIILLILLIKKISEICYDDAGIELFAACRFQTKHCSIKIF